MKDKKKNKTLGTVTVPLKRLLGLPKMALDQRFKLEHSGSHSELLLKLCLRVSELRVVTFENHTPCGYYVYMECEYEGRT